MNEFRTFKFLILYNTHSMIMTNEVYILYHVMEGEIHMTTGGRDTHVMEGEIHMTTGGRDTHVMEGEIHMTTGGRDTHDYWRERYT